MRLQTGHSLLMENCQAGSKLVLVLVLVLAPPADDCLGEGCSRAVADIPSAEAAPVLPLPPAFRLWSRKE